MKTRTEYESRCIIKAEFLYTTISKLYELYDGDSAYDKYLELKEIMFRDKEVIYGTKLLHNELWDFIENKVKYTNHSYIAQLPELKEDFF